MEHPTIDALSAHIAESLADTSRFVTDSQSPHATTAIGPDTTQQPKVSLECGLGRLPTGAKTAASGLLSAQCRLAMLPPHSDSNPLRIEQLQPHILPALADALQGFGKLCCHSEVAALLYIRARIWHSVGSAELRARDARAFVRAEESASKAAARATGRALDYAQPGALEAHIAQLKVLDAEAITLYTVNTA